MRYTQRISNISLLKQIYLNKHTQTNIFFICKNNIMYKGRVVQFNIADTNAVVYVVAGWCMLWPSGVCSGRVVYVVAEWCMLWLSGVCCG